MSFCTVKQLSGCVTIHDKIQYIFYYLLNNIVPNVLLYLEKE